MEQERAVKKMMLDIKLENIIPEVCYPFVRERLKLMWLVGYEASPRSYPLPKKRKQVRVIDKKGEILGEFDGLQQAADFIDVSYNAANIGVRKNYLVNKKYYLFYV